MLATVRIEVERRRIRHITTRVVGYDRNVIADFTLVRITFQWIKGIGYRYVS